MPPIQGGAPDDSTPPEAFPPISGGAPNDEEPAPTEGEPAAPEPTPEPVTPEASAPEPVATSEPAPEPSSEPTPEAPAEPAPVAAELPSEPAASEAAPEPQPSTEAGAEVEATAESSTPPPAEGEAGTGTESTPTPPPSSALTQPPKGPRKSKSKGDHPRSSKPKGPPPPPTAHAADARVAQLSYVIVNEAGASVYSASTVGQEEFPEFDAETRGTISIGRRLQDPLAELVKIEPQHIGVGLYQHDVNPKQLKESLETVIESCVNFVGVDLNSASVPLLQHVSGLNSLTARRIADFRKEKGPFTSREQLQEVEGVGPATFTQAAGFLKIGDERAPARPDLGPPRELRRRRQTARTTSDSPPELAHGQGASCPTLHGKLNETDPTVALQGSGSRRAHPPRHLRGPRPPRSRPPRRPPQAHLQEAASSSSKT